MTSYKSSYSELMDNRASGSVNPSRRSISSASLLVPSTENAATGGGERSGSSGRPRSGSNASNFAIPQPHTHSNLGYSSSVVREQSLALGFMERRGSFDSPISPSGIGSSYGAGNESPSWATVSAGSSMLPGGSRRSSGFANLVSSMTPISNPQQLPPNASANVFQQQQQQQQQQEPLSMHRQFLPALQQQKFHEDEVQKSPPSGLSLLLHKPKEKSKVNSDNGSRSDDLSVGAQDASSSSSTGTVRRKPHSPSSPPPARIDTTPSTLSRSSGGVGSTESSASSVNINNNNSNNSNNKADPAGFKRNDSGLSRQSTHGSDQHGDEFDDAAIEHLLDNSKQKSARGAAGWLGSIVQKLQPFSFNLSGLTSDAKSSEGDEGEAQETDWLLPRHNGVAASYDSVGQQYAGEGGSLTGGSRRDSSGGDDDEEDVNGYLEVWKDVRSIKLTRKVLVQKCIVEPVSFIPAVILGLLLNLLDAVSYGMIIFPLNVAPFQDLGPDGISMFFVSCVVSQLVYSLGGSAFKGGNGSMMIEVVPFLHLMAETVVSRVGAENREEVLATTILAYALSTVMTGTVFLLLGSFKLGSLIAFFPRHILVGCIGGVGWFLVITGFEISARMTTSLTYSWETLKFLFASWHIIALWFSSFGLALLLRALQRKIRHPFLVPTFFMVVPGVFYALVWALDIDWAMLRSTGWVFPLPEGNAPGYQFYTYFDLTKTNWSAILETVPAMLALTFFGILHVPINVPALGVSTGQDNVDTNRELVAHGWSNLISGGFGTVQNYLVYTNSLLFIKSGGDSRVAGIMLAAVSLVVFFIGPWIVGYIPVMVVGSLIFHLGMDLVKEALWDTWGLVHPLEYLTIAIIVIAMAVFGFVEGIFMGILLACVFFVVTNSRKDGVRYSCTGESAKSTVRRVYRQQKFLRNVGRQIYIFKLQGDMFFGTINKVEKDIRNVFSRRRWEINPIQFLILDFSLVRGVDFSAAEGFGRIRRAVRAKGVCLVLSGLDEDGEVGKALQMVGVWGAGAGAGMGEGHGHGQDFANDGYDTQNFPGLSEALEFCENCLLASYYATRESTLAMAQRQRLLEAANQEDLNSSSTLSPDSEATKFFSENLQNSPRKSHLFEAAKNTLHGGGSSNRPFPHPVNLQQPVPCLLAAFHDTRENSIDFFLRLSLYFVRRTVLAGTILWRQGGDASDGIYLVEDGTLRSVQEFQDSGTIRRSVEVILPGTISGEIGLFTGNQRSSTVVSETDGILWGLDQAQFQKMVKDDPALAVEFMRVAMSYSAERLNTMAAYAFNLS